MQKWKICKIFKRCRICKQDITVNAGVCSAFGNVWLWYVGTLLYRWGGKGIAQTSWRTFKWGKKEGESGRGEGPSCQRGGLKIIMMIMIGSMENTALHFIQDKHLPSGSKHSLRLFGIERSLSSWPFRKCISYFHSTRILLWHNAEHKISINNRKEDRHGIDWFGNSSCKVSLLITLRAIMA